MRGPLEIPVDQGKSPMIELEIHSREIFHATVLIQEVNLSGHIVLWKKQKWELCIGLSMGRN